MKENKKLKIFSVFATLVVCIGGVAGIAFADQFDARIDNHVLFWQLEQEKQEQLRVEKQSIGGALIGLLMGIIIANAVVPLIANQTADLEGNADLDSNEQDLVGLWTTLVILAVTVMIVGSAI